MKNAGIWLEWILGVTAGVVLFIMMMITAVDVGGRYLLNKPLPGGFELTEIMLATLIYCALPLVSKQREHIVIDTFDSLMSPSVKRGFDILADVICSLVLSGIGYLIFRRAVRVAEYGDTTNVLKLPLAPVAYAMAVMIVIAALIHIALIFVPHDADDGASII
jgi:TRAP-type C4-dicarboxylate transport system permease small subunit